MNRPLVAGLTLTLACTSAPVGDDEAGTTTNPSTAGDDDDGESVTSNDDSTATDDDPTIGSSDDDAAVTFVSGWDIMGDPCDSFLQDCPEDMKCVPYAAGGGTWDSNKCVPILGDQATGEPCKYDGAVESTDDCDGMNWCWNVDENGNGICHAFCGGTPDTPECPPMSHCSINGSGGINLCIPTCDPVAQECLDEMACFWTGLDFTCTWTTQNISTGQPCGFINDCAEGNVCVDAAVLPMCNGSACCTNYCHLQQGDTQCAALPGTACMSFFEEGMAPPGLEHVGICILPP
jgi:hypothetical protein